MKDQILLRIQKDFPLVPKPFYEIAKDLNLTEEEVINIIKKEKDNKIIRQISAIFDTKSLNYKSSLVAFYIDENDIDDAVNIINSHPGVSHNYERNHKFNIWFTCAVSPNSKLGLEKTIEILAKKTKSKDYIILPTLKMFKISVKLDTTGKEAKKEKVSHKKKEKITLTNKDIEIIKLLQEDIDIISEPFLKICNNLDITYDELFDTIKKFKNSGVMRRFAAILNHRKAGFNANAMVVWDIDEEKAIDIGKIAASFSAVSHCYLRPKYPSWPYNLFTMIHGKTKDDTNRVIEDIKQEIEYKDYMPLYSSREFKKVRLKYFNDEESTWEEKILKEN